MDGLASLFMLFVAAIVGLLTYIVVPFTPITVLMLAAGAGLVGALWWHWTQFSTEYRTSTWQEQLRNYAAYVMVAVVILVSYTFYVFGWGGVSGYVTSAVSEFRDVTVGTLSEVASNVGSAAAATGTTLFASSNSGAGGIVNAGGSNANRNRNRNLMGRNAILE
jgi:hypothetical protein